ncbi:MAG: GHKL domain-containing protein [Treponema sp.]|nr:GHKL domain-containing protein [Treponema sp.]
MSILYWILICLFLVVFAAVLSHLLTKKQDEKWLYDFQDSILKKQRDEVENVYNTMRGWRHDYHNHMQTLKAYLSMNQIEEMGKYLDHLEEDLDSIDIAIRTGNTSVNAILSSKISIAQKQMINVNCKATVPQTLKITDVHLCAIIGNLLDNAIEACEKVSAEKRFIRVYIGLFKQQLYISVTNATESSRRKKLTELITSKKGEHGLGLKRVDNLVSEYEGFVNRKNEPGVFATEIMLPL